MVQFATARLRARLPSYFPAPFGVDFLPSWSSLVLVRLFCRAFVRSARREGPFASMRRKRELVTIAPRTLGASASRFGRVGRVVMVQFAASRSPNSHPRPAVPALRARAASLMPPFFLLSPFPPTALCPVPFYIPARPSSSVSFLRIIPLSAGFPSSSDPITPPPFHFAN